jgi:ATP-dependent metalloprotease
MADFEYSHDKQTLGTDWKSRVVHKDDLKITAYHEAGHTLVNIFTENTHPLHKVTIVSKGRTGGHTAFVPERDSTHWSKAEMLAQMDTAMGGRAAEEIILGKDKITGGASSDLEGATNIAKLYVKKLGMSEKFGLRVVGDRQEEIEMSESTKNLMDTEVTRLLNDSYKNATNILKTHRKELDLLADALLKYETLDADDVKAILEGNSKALGTRNTLNSTSKIQFTNNSQVNNLPSGKPEDISPGNGGVLL